MENNIEMYQKLSHKLALKQLEEKFIFEMIVNKILFNNPNVSLDILINDDHNRESFTDDEYIKTFKKSKKIVENSSVDIIYDDIINLGKSRCFYG